MSGRVIFLDIDGVILPTRTWAASENLRWLAASPLERSPHLLFDPGAVGLLVQLALLAGARFVLHSNWRRNWPDAPDALLEKLIRSGIARELWHAAWSVPIFEGRDKAHEISEWLQAPGARPCRGLVIDDAPLGPLDAAGPIEIAQLRPSRDEGFGMAEYRAGLDFFGVSDPRVTKSPVAPLWPVERRTLTPEIPKAPERPMETSKDEAIEYLWRALEGRTSWEEFRDVVTALPDSWVFEAYFPLAAQDAPGAPMAALLLGVLGTECPIACKEAVRALLEGGWNPSIEELPHYLAACFGADLRTAISELLQEPLPEMQRNLLQTVGYWTSSSQSEAQPHKPRSREQVLQRLGRYWSWSNDMLTHGRSDTPQPRI